MDGIESFLTGDERILWRGEPRKGVFLKPSDAYVIPFSLMWCGFIVFWEWGAINSRAPFFFKIFGVPFIAVGLYMLVGRFVVDALIRDRTQYAVTNQRVVIVWSFLRLDLRSFDLRNLGEMSLTLSFNDRGTITFGALLPRNRRSMLGDDPRPKFDTTEGARVVHDLIRTAQQEALRSTASQTSPRW